MFWKPTVAIQADVGTFLVELSEAADGIHSYDPEWISTLQRRDREKESATEKVILLKINFMFEFEIFKFFFFLLSTFQPLFENLLRKVDVV